MLLGSKLIDYLIASRSNGNVIEYVYHVDDDEMYFIDAGFRLFDVFGNQSKIKPSNKYYVVQNEILINSLKQHIYPSRGIFIADLSNTMHLVVDYCYETDEYILADNSRIKIPENAIKVIQPKIIEKMLIQSKLFVEKIKDNL